MNAVAGHLLPHRRVQLIRQLSHLQRIERGRRGAQYRQLK